MQFWNAWNFVGVAVYDYFLLGNLQSSYVWQACEGVISNRPQLSIVSNRTVDAEKHQVNLFFSMDELWNVEFN